MVSLISILKTIESLDLTLGELKTNEIIGGGSKVDNKKPSKESKNIKSEI